MIRSVVGSPETLAVLIAMLVAGIAGPMAARVHRRVVTRRLVSRRSAPTQRRRRGLVATWRRTAARLLPRRHRRPPPAAVAAWCDGIGRRIRAGSTLRDALMATDSTDPALATAIGEIRHRLERGEPLGVALERPTSSDGQLGLGLAVISATARLGGPSSQPLDRVAAALRLRAADEQERTAHSAQARMSAHVLTFVPLGFLGLMLTLDDGVRTAATTPAGAAIIGAGLLLNGLGWFWMRTIIGRGSA
jgi:Flp pilus assembly protein TadB